MTGEHIISARTYMPKNHVKFPWNSHPKPYQTKIWFPAEKASPVYHIPTLPDNAKPTYGSTGSTTYQCECSRWVVLVKHRQTQENQTWFRCSPMFTVTICYQICYQYQISTDLCCWPIVHAASKSAPFFGQAKPQTNSMAMLFITSDGAPWICWLPITTT